MLTEKNFCKNIKILNCLYRIWNRSNFCLSVFSRSLRCCYSSQIWQTEPAGRKSIYPFRSSARVCYRQTSFSEPGNVWKKCPFTGHIVNKFRWPIILQLNIEGLTASKINVLQYLALQSEALVILLQETHCTDAEKLVLPDYQLPGSSQPGSLACHVCPQVTEVHGLDQFSPTSEVEW